MTGFEEFDILSCIFLAAAAVKVMIVIFSGGIDFISHKYLIL
jgi:hypothetical protein